MLNSKIMKEKKSPFIIYADFESILVPEDNGNQNPEEPHTNRYQKDIACSYDYRLVCTDDNFRKPFKTYLGKYAVNNFINSMIKEGKYCSEVKKRINKELVMSKEGNQNFKKSTKCWICDNDYVDNHVKVRDHFYITGK